VGLQTNRVKNYPNGALILYAAYSQQFAAGHRGIHSFQRFPENERLPETKARF
jgi:hypothetical protein